MLARSSGMVKVGGCVYQEVFMKQLLIIKVWLLLQNRALKYSTKTDCICPGLDFVSWTVHESSKRVWDTITNYEGHYEQ